MANTGQPHSYRWRNESTRTTALVSSFRLITTGLNRQDKDHKRAHYLLKEYHLIDTQNMQLSGDSCSCFPISLAPVFLFHF